MKDIKYRIVEKEKITTDMAKEVVFLLKKQGKVNAPNIDKVKECQQIILCSIDNVLVGIAALKPKIKAVFYSTKANLSHLEPDFELELGYFYTNESCRNLGIASTMTKLLLNKRENENFFATTEIYSTNPMIFILEKYNS